MVVDSDHKVKATFSVSLPNGEEQYDFFLTASEQYYPMWWGQPANLCEPTFLSWKQPLSCVPKELGIYGFGE